MIFFSFLFSLRPLQKNCTVEVKGGSGMFGTEYLKNALKEFLQNLKEISEYTLKLSQF